MNLLSTSDFRPGPLAAIVEQIVPRAIAATSKATSLVAQTARQLAPVDKGDLKGSIKTEVILRGPTVEGTVFADSDHAAFVEYGTGIRGASSPHGELPTEGVPYTGSWVYDYKSQGWMGMPAQPFLRPAIDINHRGIMDAYASEGFAT